MFLRRRPLHFWATTANVFAQRTVTSRFNLSDRHSSISHISTLSTRNVSSSANVTPSAASDNNTVPPLSSSPTTVPFPPYNYTFLEPPSQYDPPLEMQTDAQNNNRNSDDDQTSMNIPKYTGPEPKYHETVTGYNVFNSSQPFHCTWSDGNPNHGVLEDLEIAYETWGELNAARDNAVLLHTGLSASSHARSNSGNEESGWWEDFIGPGRCLDTDKFFIICSNNLGGCYGTTGPGSINPATDRPYGMT